MTRQRGTSLVLGLVLLALLTLLVTTAASDSLWQGRITTNQLGEERALRAARSAVAWAEQWLMSLPGDQRPAACTSPCGAGGAIHAAGALPASLEGQDEAWWQNHAQGDGFDPATGTQREDRRRPGTPPARWLVEEVHVEAGAGTDTTVYYRIVARAARAPRGRPVFLELLVARPWGDLAWADALPRDDVSFCVDMELSAPCGRMAWRRRQ